jgi:hypothetical protein
MYEFSQTDDERTEECEILLDRAAGSYAYRTREPPLRRTYFTVGDVSDIHVASWKNLVEGSGWAPTQDMSDFTDKQHTGMAAHPERVLRQTPRDYPRRAHSTV